MQELDIHQIDQAIDSAVEKKIPLNISVEDSKWANMHSRFIAVRDGHILVELPMPQDGCCREFVPAEKLGLSFKLKHHKYLANVRVAGTDLFRLDNGTDIHVLSLCFPMHMQRLQRRSFTRVAVPAGRIVRVSFWPGDYHCEPTGPSPQAPVYSGCVEDLSAGGFQVVVNVIDPPEWEAGQTVGVRIAFGAGDETIYTDAQFRHCVQKCVGQYSMGFQFSGLGYSKEGRNVLQILGSKISEFNRAANAAKRRKSFARQ